jgi:hypothetical protein
MSSKSRNHPRDRKPLPRSQSQPRSRRESLSSGSVNSTTPLTRGLDRDDSRHVEMNRPRTPRESNLEEHEGEGMLVPRRGYDLGEEEEDVGLLAPGPVSFAFALISPLRSPFFPLF